MKIGKALIVWSMVGSVLWFCIGVLVLWVLV